MRIRALGDFSVTYEVSGRLSDTKTFLGSKSALHLAVLDSLHRNGVEIVSPTFMNQRQIAGGSVFIPSVEPEAPADPTRARGPDTLVFDKADQVEKAEDLRKRLTVLDQEITELDAQLKAAKASSDEGAGGIEKTLEARRRSRDWLAGRIHEMDTEIDG